MNMEEKAQLCKSLQSKFLMERQRGDIDLSFKTEREYLNLRKELIDAVTTEMTTHKSVLMSDILKRVDNRKKEPKRETGIRSLDRELVSELDYGRGKTGGFALGNMINIAGVKGSGKSTILMSIMAGYSNVEKVSWINFEMSDEKAVDTLRKFDFKAENMFYYDSSREINDIVNEIKFLYSLGVRHFVIDSMMKIRVNGMSRGHESFSHASDRLSELSSSLRINIYLINQLSQDSVKNGHLMLKHGNDAEYDADYIFFILKKPTAEKDKYGQVIFDENVRLITCTKNRPDTRLFTVEVQKSEIMKVDTGVEIVYEESVYMPTV